MANRNKHIFLLLCLVAAAPFIGFGQTPFLRTGQVFLAIQEPSQVANFTISLGGTPVLSNLATVPFGGLDALGFRKTDNLLYGIAFSNNHLYRIGSDGIAQDIGAPPLNNTLFYLAGDVSHDGQFLYSIGSNAGGNDVHLAKTDLTDPSFATTIVPMAGFTAFVDIAFHPITGLLYGYDAVSRQMMIVNPVNASLTTLGPISIENEIKGLYFDAFGDLYAYGSSLSGIVDAFFVIDKITGQETRLATGSVFNVRDAASCPFSVELKQEANPDEILPCTEFTYTYSLANSSGETFTGLQFVQTLPPGFHLSAVVQNQLGAAIDTVSQPGSIVLNNFALPTGKKNLALKIKVSDIPEGNYKSQAVVKNLPALYGSESRSDNAASSSMNDSTTVEVYHIDVDSFYYSWFICQGDVLTLDASSFGENIVWSTGATSPTLEVTGGGIYSIEVETGCQTFEVTHDVTSASCPFTISLEHVFLPDTTFPCSDLTARYIFDNDSGEERKQVEFIDTLPEGFSFIAIQNSPAGAVLSPDLPPNVIHLENINLPIGKDTLDLLVHVGDVPPGNLFNRAMINNLPHVLGPTRLSDYPLTIPADSTRLHLLGAWSDSLRFDTVVCENAELILDASHLSRDYLWPDGSSNPTFVVKEPGEYRLNIFDGCEPIDVIWKVEIGKPIDIELPASVSIHQGEEVALNPLIFNQGDSLYLLWNDPLGNSLSCLDCARPVAIPLESVAYSLFASNEICADTASISIAVDDKRRIYAPNAFSPNQDGINDFFYLQSPDFGLIRRLTVLNRWGGTVFNSATAVLNVEKSGWDGSTNDHDASVDTYTWIAEIEFIDGKRSIFSGSVALMK